MVFCKVNEAATGMMLVKKEVFTKMIKAFPEKEYKTDQIINGKITNLKIVMIYLV